MKQIFLLLIISIMFSMFGCKPEYKVPVIHTVVITEKLYTPSHTDLVPIVTSIGKSVTTQLIMMPIPEQCSLEGIIVSNYKKNLIITFQVNRTQYEKFKINDTVVYDETNNKIKE